jgi:hypothetical protein
MNGKWNILISIVLVSLSCEFVLAKPVEKFLGTIQCTNSIADLRSGSFKLAIGDVRLKSGKGCVKLSPNDSNCEWTVELKRVEKWGSMPKFLLVVLNANHESGSGSWDSVLMYVCQGRRFVPVFAERYLYGAKIEVDSTPSFSLRVGEWLPNDPICCPSRENKKYFVWSDTQRQFVLRDSKVTVTEKP